MCVVRACWMLPVASPKARSRKSSSDHRDKKHEDDPNYDKKRAEAEKERRKRKKLEAEAEAKAVGAESADAEARRLANINTAAMARYPLARPCTMACASGVRL